MNDTHLTVICDYCRGKAISYFVTRLNGTAWDGSSQKEGLPTQKIQTDQLTTAKDPFLVLLLDPAILIFPDSSIYEAIFHLLEQ